MALSFDGSDVPVQSLSIASMPQAPSERWLVPQQRTTDGKVTPVTLPSMSLGTDRKIWVYTPPGYDPRASSPYHLLVMFDGYSYLHWIPAPTILDNLTHAQQIRPPSPCSSTIRPNRALRIFTSALRSSVS